MRTIRDQPLPLALLVALVFYIGAAVSMETLVTSARGVLRDSMQRSMVATAQLAALSVDPIAHSMIRRRDQDGTREYDQVARPLRAILATVPDLYYVYTFRKDATGIRFAVDATPSGDRDGDGIDDHSFTDELYEEPDPSMLDAVAKGTVAVTPDPHTDRWGTFASAYAPVRHADGAIECFVGVDIDATDYEARLNRMSYAKQAGLGVAAAASVVLGAIVYGLRRSGRRAQRAAQLTAERLERTAYNLPGAIYVCSETADGARRMPFASNGLHQVLGLTPEEVLHDATPATAIVHEADQARMMASAADAKRSMTLWHEEYRIRRPDGEVRWIEGRALPTPTDGGGVMWYGYVCDITERKRTALALEQAKAAAEAASKAKNEFVAKVSHELRTPISAIAGYSELLREGPAAPGTEVQITEREAVEAIGRNATHLLALVNDILDVARIEAGQMKLQRVPTDLRELAEDIMDGFRLRVAERRLSLYAQIDKGVPRLVMSDPVRLRQVLTNLVTNAVKFTDRGSVWLCVRNEGADEIAISVRDTGPGMTAEQIARLFQPFTQLDNSMSRGFGGAGLGLSICKQLTELMGGTIDVHSTAGRGSEFTVRIPRTETTEEQCAASEPRPPTSVLAATAGMPGASERIALAGTGWGAVPAPIEGPAPLEGCRILLAEDGPDNARLIRHHLRAAGALVTHVWDGRGATRLVEGPSDGEDIPFDLILLDMQMPEMDGYAATQHMRAHSVAIPIVALTAHASPADKERCLAVGCNDYATKPIPKADLIELCRKWARKPTRGAAVAPASAQ